LRRTSSPKPLPDDYLAQLSASARFNLLLDYDGTLAPIVNDPSLAKPCPGVKEALERLARCKGRVLVAVVTGRPIDEVRHLLGIEGSILFSGVHGMQIRDGRGHNRSIAGMREYRASLEAARAWLERNVPPARGFRIENKSLAVSLHFRQANQVEAQQICTKFAEFIQTETPKLRLLPLKKVLEALPQKGGKARAVTSLKRRFRASDLTIYFGDDVTDEEVFAALEAKDVGVLVGAKRSTLAHYYVDGPSDVARQLTSLATALGE
jgi:trehalose-phosphatase